MPRRAGIRPAVALFAIFCCVQLLIGAVLGQQPTLVPVNDDLPALLKRMEANRRANARLAARYTFDETRNTKTFNHKGKLVHEDSERFVSVIIDGVDYNRVVEENGKPVPEKQQVSEQKRQDAISELGQNYDFAFELVGVNPRDYIYSDLPISYLSTLFDNRVVGRELINGRDNLVVESTPKANVNPGSGRAQTALDWKETTWIDVEDAMPTRYEVELLRDKKYLLKGGTSQRELTRLPVTQSENSHWPENVWMIHGWNAHYSWRMFRITSSSVSKADFYNYKRFQSDAHVLEDSVQEVPAPAKQR